MRKGKFIGLQQTIILKELSKYQGDSSMCFFIFFYFTVYPHPRTCLKILERREGQEREGEKHPFQRETPIGCVLYVR